MTVKGQYGAAAKRTVRLIVFPPVALRATVVPVYSSWASSKSAPTSSWLPSAPRSNTRPWKSGTSTGMMSQARGLVTPPSQSSMWQPSRGFSTGIWCDDDISYTTNQRVPESTIWQHDFTSKFFFKKAWHCKVAAVATTIHSTNACPINLYFLFEFRNHASFSCVTSSLKQEKNFRRKREQKYVFFNKSIKRQSFYCFFFQAKQSLFHLLSSLNH